MENWKRCLREDLLKGYRNAVLSHLNHNDGDIGACVYKYVCMYVYMYVYIYIYIYIHT